MTSKSKELFPLKKRENKRVGQKAEEREILTREDYSSPPSTKETDRQKIRKRGHLTVTSEKNDLKTRRNQQ